MQTNTEEENKTCCRVSMWDTWFKHFKDISMSLYFYHFILVVFINKMLDNWANASDLKTEFNMAGKSTLHPPNEIKTISLQDVSFPERIDIALLPRILWTKFLKYSSLTCITYLLLHKKSPQKLVA